MTEKKIELKNKGLNGVLNDLKEDEEFFTIASKVLTNRIKITESFLDGQFSNNSLNHVYEYLHEKNPSHGFYQGTEQELIID